MLRTIGEILERARGGASGRLAVAAAHDEEVLKAASAAAREGIAEPILLGEAAKISSILSDLGERPGDFRIIEAPGASAAAQAARLVDSGEADFLMKGILGTGDLLRAILDKELRLRTGRLMSHVMLYEVPAYPKLLALTDGGMNTFPDLEKKTEILENAAILLRDLGYTSIDAACVCGAEVVDPKIQSTVDAAALASMEARWAPYGMRVIGPVGLDLAISEAACLHKGYSAPGAGKADILLVPSYEVGNGIGKALSYFGRAKSAGIVLGASVPIVLVSRADDAEAKLASIALGALVSGAEREGGR